MILSLASGEVVCPRCTLADTLSSRTRGLLGRRSLGSGEGLLLCPARSVHTAFMRFPIDAVFLDRELSVIDVVGLVPWRLAGRAGARAVLELGHDQAHERGIHPGTRLVVT